MIPVEAHRNALQADVIALLSPTGKEDGLEKTFWIDYFEGQTSRLNEEVMRTRCSLERLALAVLQFHTRADGTVEGVVNERDDKPHRVFGVEWWVQARSQGGQPSLDLHFDADEEHKNHVRVATQTPQPPTCPSAS